VAIYRFRATFGRRWGGYLALVLFIGLIGGLAMGSVAGARRTQSSFPTYLASTDPADLEGITSFVNPMPGAAGLGYNPALMTKIAHLPHVRQFSYFAGLNILPIGRGGVPESPPAYPAEAGEASGLGTTVATVPVTIVVVIAIGAVVLGNLVAALPARMAARTPTALLLRAE
jgi:hypothetical protein